MSDLIIKGAKGIPDGLYVIKDGEFFKYKEKGGTVRSYHITDRPRGEWLHHRTDLPYVRWHIWECSACREKHEYMSNFCPNCGADMRGEDE